MSEFQEIIKLNYKCPKGTVDDSNKCEGHEPIKGIPSDVKLDQDRFVQFYEASKRGVFNFHAIKDKESYNVIVSPKKIPDNWKIQEEGDGRKSYYDPEYYDAKPLSEGSSIITLKRKKDYVDDLEGKEEGHLFRGMSYDEYESILKNGFIQSKGDYNFDNQEGLTYFSTDKGQASYYASGFAPWQYQATPDKPAVMVTVKEPSKEMQNMVLASGSDEVGVRGKVLQEDIVDVYFGYPVAVTEGYFEVRGKNAEMGSSVGYTSRIRWEKREKQKLNYKCKSGTVDESNKCGDNKSADNKDLVKKIRRNDDLYKIFNDIAKTGPLDGGCYAMAKALQNTMGGELYTLVDKDGIGQHVVLKKDNVYWDGNGKSSEKKLLKEWEENEFIKLPSLRPFQEEDVPDSPRSTELIDKVTEHLNPDSTPSDKWGTGKITLYRGEHAGGEGRFYSTDKEFTRQFTQSGQDKEITKITFSKSDVYKPKESVYAGDPDAVDVVVKDAIDKGFKAVLLSEGEGEPNSIFMINPKQTHKQNSEYIQLNYKCKKGTKNPDTNECIESMTLADVENKVSEVTGAKTVSLKGIKKVDAKVILDTLKSDKISLLSIDSTPRMAGAAASMQPNRDGTYTLHISARHLAHEKEREDADSYDGRIKVYKEAIDSLTKQMEEFPPDRADLRYKARKLIYSHEHEVEKLEKEKSSGKPFLVQGICYKFSGDDRTRATIYHEIGHYRLFNMSKEEQKQVVDAFRSTKDFPSKLSQKDYHEWFAENYALKKMGQSHDSVINKVKLNYKCPKGTVDDSNRCPENSESQKFVSNPSLDRDTLLLKYEHNFDRIGTLMGRGVGDPTREGDSEEHLLKIGSFVESHLKEHNLGKVNMYVASENSQVKYMIRKPSILIIDSKLTRDDQVERLVEKWKEKKEKNGMDWAIASLVPKDKILDTIITHEMGHIQLGKYTKKMEPNVKTKNRMDGTEEWMNLVSTEASNGWRPPSSYSMVDFGEMFAECYAAKQLGMDHLLSPRISEFVDRVIKHNKGG